MEVCGTSSHFHKDTAGIFIKIKDGKEIGLGLVQSVFHCLSLTCGMLSHPVDDLHSTCGPRLPSVNTVMRINEW